MKVAEKPSLSDTYRDIEHHYNSTLVRMLFPLAKLLIKLNSDVEFDGLESISSTKWKPNLIMFQHWSLYDTIIGPYGLHRRGIQPKIGAGRNLPAQSVLRILGAFKVPRDDIRKFPKEWKEVRGYVTQLLKDGNTVVVYPGFFYDGKEKETGRSKCGHHQEFSSIFFTSVDDAWKQGADPQITVGNIIYERIPEDTSIITPREQKDKKQYVLDVVGILRPKIKRQSALVVYGKPHSFAELREKKNLSQIKKECEEESSGFYRPTSLDIAARTACSLGGYGRYDRGRFRDVELGLIDQFKRQGIRLYRVPEDIEDMEEKVQEIAPDILRFGPNYVEVLDTQLVRFYNNRTSHLLTTQNNF